MSYTIAYVDAENTFENDQILTNGSKLKGRTIDDNRDIDLVHLDGEGNVRVGDPSSPVNISGKSIMINGKDLESEIDKVFQYGVNQKRKITDSINSLYSEGIVSEKSKWSEINGVLEKKDPYKNYSFFLSPQRQHYLSASKSASLTLYSTEKWQGQQYIVCDNSLLLFGGSGYVDGVKRRVDYVASVDLTAFRKGESFTIVPKKREESLLQDVHLVECGKSIYCIPKVITTNDSRRIRQYVVNSDSWSTACLLTDLKIGDTIDGGTNSDSMVFFSVNKGERMIIFNINTRETIVTEVNVTNEQKWVDEVIYTNGKVYCPSFEQGMSSYEIVDNIPCYDTKGNFSLVEGNNIGGSIYKIEENYYNFQRPNCPLGEVTPICIYDYTMDRIIGVRSHSKFHLHRNNIAYGIVQTTAGATTIYRVNLAYLFNSRVVIPISNGDSIVVNDSCKVYITGVSLSTTVTLYPNIKNTFYLDGFIQIEPLDVTKYIFGGVVRA